MDTNAIKGYILIANNFHKNNDFQIHLLQL